jgi:hypothetical protein
MVGDFNGDKRADLLRLENVYGGAEVLVVDGSQVFTGSGLDGFSFWCGTNRVLTGIDEERIGVGEGASTTSIVPNSDQC